MYQRPPELIAATRHDLIELNELRLDHDWTFPRLAEAMAKAQCSIKRSTLYNLLRPGATTIPNERTLHRIRKFIELVHRTEEAQALERERRREEREAREERRRRASALGDGTGEEAS